MGWLSGGLAVVCLAVGVLHLVRLAVRRRDVADGFSHAVMGLGMAAMAAPHADPVAPPLWTILFLLCAAWFTTAPLRRRSGAGDGPHHVLSSAAMLLMLGAGHGANGDAAPATLGRSVAALAFAGYFACHALWCADRCRTPEPGTAATPSGGAAPLLAPARSLAEPRLVIGSHAVMSVAMVVMLLALF